MTDDPSSPSKKLVRETRMTYERSFSCEFIVRVSWTENLGRLSRALVRELVRGLLKSVPRGQCDARPTVTFPAAGHHRLSTDTELYCLVTGTCHVWTTCLNATAGSRAL